MTPPFKVLVVDDHATVREGLIRILTSSDDKWQVDSAPSAEAALDILALQAFDVGIVDMSMPGMNGIELVRALRAQGLRMPLLMLSMHAEEAYALRAFKAGANGYIAKDRAAEELVAAVRRVAGGGAHVPAALTERVVLTMNGEVAVPRHAQLSDRELDILRRLAGGLGVTDIAEQLGLAPKTVMNSRARIQDKLALTSPQALTAYAIEHGLVPSGGHPMHIEIDDLSRPQVHALLQEHLDDMYAWSPPESVHALDLDRLRLPAITFWTAWEGPLLLGSAALKDLGDGHGEVKSMRTPRHLRGRGAGRALLAHLIDHARARGFQRLSLETGTTEPVQPAQRLYERFGFAYCGPFGDYTPDPFSVFMTLEL